MEPDFPGLDMSIGEYYKLLKENRGRVTRHAAAAISDSTKREHHKEEPKKPAPAPKAPRSASHRKPKEPSEERHKKRPAPEPEAKPKREEPAKPTPPSAKAEPPKHEAPARKERDESAKDKAEHKDKEKPAESRSTRDRDSARGEHSKDSRAEREREKGRDRDKDKERDRERDREHHHHRLHHIREPREHRHSEPKERSAPAPVHVPEKPVPAAAATKKHKKFKEEPKKTAAEEPLHKYTQNLPDGVFRANVAGRVAHLRQKPKGASSAAQLVYVRFSPAISQKSDSYTIEVLDQDNIRKTKTPPVTESISLKQEKVYLIIEPAWLCTSFGEPQYQPVLVLLNIGRTDIEDLQLPDQPPPSDYKSASTKVGDRQSIFSTEQRVLIVNPETGVLTKCSTDLLFHYNPALDSAVRQAAIKRSSGVSMKLYADLDYLYELNQKWLHDNEEVEITCDNAKDCLFSEVTFGEKRGVLLHFFAEKKALCIRVYKGQEGEEPVAPQTEWVYLKDADTKVSANMLKGRVTLLELENFDPAEPNLAYVPQYKYCDIQEDEEAKPKVEGSAELKRCKQCDYVMDKLEYRECGKCGDFYHLQCLAGETSRVGLRDRYWRCPNCARCCVCLSNKDKKSLIGCSLCNTCFHTKCMEPEIFNQMPSTNKGSISWKCDRCAKCVGCGCRSAGSSKHSKWNSDYTLCSKCKKKKSNNQYCPVCEQIWTSTDEEPMIECTCGMWVHKCCDKSLTEDTFNAYKQTSKEYSCPKCRKNKRNMFIMQIIDILVGGDKYQLFYNPVDVTAVPNYLTVIKQPMCFKTMREKVTEGIYILNPELLKHDFNLICHNAMTFNMPKTNYYKEAESLYAFGSMILNNNWATLMKFKNMSEEENKYAKLMIEKGRHRKPSISTPTKPANKESKSLETAEEGNKLIKKALRKHRVINYNEDPVVQTLTLEQSAADVPGVIAPTIPLKKKKSTAGKKVSVPAPAKKEPVPEKKPASQQDSHGGEGISLQGIQGYFELLAQREEEASKCLYSNPIVAQFTDPTLCFAEMCSLCGAFGNTEDFITCIVCGESYHPYCVSLPSCATAQDIDKLKHYWKCFNCRYCEHCCKATGEDKLLYCDSCDKAYHTYCLNPPLKVVPACGWKCKDCFKCAKCGTQSFFGDHVEPLYDYSHTNNFTYCHKCGMEEHEKSFCSICKETASEPDNPLAYCSICKHWSHIRCSRINFAQYDEMVKAHSDFKCFTCLMKERSSQEIHYEVCEAYLNIHHVSYRHSMLSDVLHAVLKKYLEALDSDHANNLLAIFVEENQPFFRTDPDVNKFLQLQEGHVTYEEGSSTITSPSIIEEREREHEQQVDRLDLFSRRAKLHSRHTGRQLRDLVEISRICEGVKLQPWKADESAADVAMAENTDKEFEAVESMLDSEPKVAQMVLSEEAMREMKVQQLKKLYRSMRAKSLDPRQMEEFKSKSLFEATENSKHRLHKMSDASLLQIPSIMSNAIDATASVHHMRRLRESGDEEMKEGERSAGRKDEEEKQRPGLGPIKLALDDATGGYTPQSMNDTFLPERWNVYGSLYKHQRPRYKQDPDEYADLIRLEGEEGMDTQERCMRLEITAMLKIQKAFHRWMCKYLSGKVQELKRSLHDKSVFEKVLAGKKLEDVGSSTKGPASKPAPAENICPSPTVDVNELDSIVPNPASSIVCCMCHQMGERKLSGRLIPFHGAMYVHVNCALWSSEVFETNDGALINFFFAYRRAKSTKCTFCGKSGASLSCNTKKYHANYHFICGVIQQVAFAPNKSTYCKQCAKNKGLALGFPPELNQKRRLYIAKNTALCSGVNDLNKPGMLERWRPFVYDCFNRIGNLTVIKLNTRIDKLLAGNTHDANLLSDTDGYASLRIYWNIYKPREAAEGLPFFNGKAYYLCTGNNSSIRIQVFSTPTINIVKPYIPQYLSLGRIPDLDSVEATAVRDKDLRDMWSDWLSGVRRHLPRFSLENLAFNNNEFVGTTKFPISAWHTLNHKNLDVVLYNASESSKNIGTSSKREGPGANKHTYVTFVGELKDEVFDTIIRMNDEMGHKSTQYIAYKRTPSSAFMGKIGVRDLGPPAQPNPAKMPKRQKPKEIVYESKNVKTNVKDVDLPIAMKYRNYQHMPKKVEVAPSRIHKNGLFATDDFMMGEIVVEYVGELIRNKVADKREKIYEAKGFGDCYMFRIDKDMVVDATMFGSKARYLNHCCSPNCNAKINLIHGKKHIIIYANRHIKAGEELTYDYHFDVEAEKIPCNCGAPGCQGRLN